jgi:hypothetical protein
VVNLDRARAVTAQLLLRAPVAHVFEVDKTTGQLVSLACGTVDACHTTAEGYQVSLELAAADGRLLRLD